MSWRDRYRPASFRGVPFFVDDAQSKHGRRTVPHEYPFQNEPFIEDMGMMARTFSITGYVLGADYDTTVGQLIDACEAAGPGELVHPYRGTKTGFAQLDLEERASAGGMARFTLTFQQAGLQQYPAQTTNPLTQLGLASGSLLDAAQARFLKNITVTGVPDFVRQALRGTVGDLGTMLTKLQNTGGLLATFGTPELLNEAAGFRDLAARLQAAAANLITSPSLLAGQIRTLFGSIGRLSPSPPAAVTNYALVRQLSVTTRPAVTPLVVLENRNKTATQRFVDLVALAHEATYVPRVDYVSHEEALAARHGFLDRVAALTASADDREYDALQQIRAEIARAVPGSGQDRPRLLSLTLPQSLPALVLAYNLYEDKDRADDLVARNRQRHPGFLPAGVKLEVLSA